MKPDAPANSRAAGRWRRVNAPGLPTFPRLEHDPERGWARVTARHPTWVSCERARLAAAIASWGVALCLAGLAACRWAPDGGAPRLLIFVGVVVFARPVCRALGKETLAPFFARRLFATRTALWFSADAIGVESRLYPRPFVLWRRWEGAPVGVRFVVEPSPSAAAYSRTLSWNAQRGRGHLDDAMRLAVVLTTLGPGGGAPAGGDASMRCVPLTDVSGLLAPRFTMVYTAALRLTEADEDTQPSRREGVDIDNPETIPCS